VITFDAAMAKKEMKILKWVKQYERPKARERSLLAFFNS